MKQPLCRCHSRGHGSPEEPDADVVSAIGGECSEESACRVLPEADAKLPFNTSVRMEGEEAVARFHCISAYLG